MKDYKIDSPHIKVEGKVVLAFQCKILMQLSKKTLLDNIRDCLQKNLCQNKNKRSACESSICKIQNAIHA
jgi:hypothetical protein